MDGLIDRWVNRRQLLTGLMGVGCGVAASSLAAAPEPETLNGDAFPWEIKFAVDRKAVKGGKSHSVDLKAIEAVLKRRVPIVTLAEDAAKLTLRTPDDILLRFPSDEVVEPQLKMMIRPGLLELRYLEDLQTNLNPKGRYLIETVTIQGTETTNRLRFRDRQADVPVTPERFLAQCPLLATTADLEPDTARRVGSGLQMAVRVQFNDRAARKLNGFAKKKGRMLAIVLDGEILGIHAFTQQERPKRDKKRPPTERDDYGAVDLSAGFGTDEEAQWLAVVLNSGALPVPLKVVRSGIYDPKQAPLEKPSTFRREKAARLAAGFRSR